MTNITVNKEQENKKLFRTIFIARTLPRMQVMVTNILWPLYLDDNRPDISTFTLSCVIGALQFGNFVTAPISGSFTSSIGHKRVLVLSMVLFAIL